MWLDFANKMVKEALSAQYHLRGLNGVGISERRKRIFEIIKRRGDTITLFHTMPKMPFPLEDLDEALTQKNDPRKLMMMSAEMLGTSANEGRKTAHEQVFFSTTPEPKHWLKSDDNATFRLVFEVPIADLLETQILIFGPEFEKWLIDKYDYNNEGVNGMDTPKDQRRQINDLHGIYMIDSEDIDIIILKLKNSLNKMGATELTSLNILPMRYLLGIIYRKDFNNDLLIYTNPNKTNEQLLNITSKCYINYCSEDNVSPYINAIVNNQNDFRFNLKSKNIEDIKNNLYFYLNNKITIWNSDFNLLAEIGDPELVELALSTGVKHAQAAFEIAIRNKNMEVIKLIVKYKAYIPNNMDINRLISWKNYDILELLLQICPEQFTSHHLLEALTRRDTESFMFLINHGVKIASVMTNLLLSMAIDWGLPEIVKVILQQTGTIPCVLQLEALQKHPNQQIEQILKDTMGEQQWLKCQGELAGQLTSRQQLSP